MAFTVSFYRDASERGGANQLEMTALAELCDLGMIQRRNRALQSLQLLEPLSGLGRRV